MREKQNYFNLKLSRNFRYMAHIRERDYAVIFTPSNNENEENSEFLFSKWDKKIRSRLSGAGKSDKKKTFSLYLVLSDECNMKCSYCDVLNHADENEKKYYMTWEIASVAMEELTRRLKEDPELYAHVVFFGGEPLLNWSLLVKICDYIESHSMRARIEKMLVTNGLLLTKDKVLFLQKHHVYVVVSLDGRKSVNDKVRLKYNGSGSFDSVSKSMEHLIKIMPNEFGISCTVGSHNAQYLSDEITYLHEKFKPLCTGINIYHFQKNGRSPIAIDDDVLCKALIDSFKVARVEGIAIYQFIGILKGFINHQRNLDYCPACVDKLLFSPHGRVGRCEAFMYDDRYTVKLNDLKNGSLSRNLDWSKYTPEYEPECISCAARWICPGTCVYDQFIKTGSLNGVELRRCKFHKQLLTELLDLLLESSLLDAKDKKIIIPDQKDYNSVLGKITINFPPHTIWIVSMSNVNEL